MATLLLASKWDVLKDVVDLVELANSLRQGDVGMWILLGVVFALLIFAVRSWHRGDLLLEKAIVRWTTAILVCGLLVFVFAVCIQGWIWIERSAWPMRVRVAPISELSSNAAQKILMDRWHGDAVEIKNATSKKMHIKRVVVNGEHELKFRINILNQIVLADPVTIEPYSSAAWYLRGTPPTRIQRHANAWFPIEEQKEKERVVAEVRRTTEQAWQQQDAEDKRVAASAFQGTATSIEVDVNGKTIHLKLQDRP